MKGLVFSFKKSSSKNLGRRNISLSDLRYFFRRYGIITFFVTILFIGIALGSVYARNSEKEFLNSLDFLFTTNLDARLTQNFAGTFCACFASDFIFLISVYLLGLAPWGILFLPVIIMFKGFGTGLTAGYLFITDSLMGVGFYLLILLPGTFLFCVSLVIFATYSLNFSKRIFFYTVGKEAPKTSLRVGVIAYSSRFMSSLIMTFLASAIDTALWTLFAGGFNL